MKILSIKIYDMFQKIILPYQKDRTVKLRDAFLVVKFRRNFGTGFYLVLLLTSIITGNCLYTNVKTPGWFYSQSYSDVRGMDPVGKLSGQSCGEGWFWLVYTGDESYEAAVQNAIQDKADLLFDVQTDYYVKSIFFNFYFYKCTRVTGIGVKLPQRLMKKE